jgi:hypothetical protein
LGDAIRDDWSNFDGRIMRYKLDNIITVLDGELTVEDFREMSDLCPSGRGHWTEYCQTYCKNFSNSSEDSETD